MGSDSSPMWTSRWEGLPPFLRFLVVGGLNTLFGYGAYAGLLWIGFHYAAAALLGTIAGVAFNFFTTGRLVFDRAHSFRHALPFLCVYAVVYAVNVISLWLLARAGLDPYRSGILLILPMAVLSFLLMRGFVFAKNHGPD